jgi:hypothetical protein
MRRREAMAALVAGAASLAGLPRARACSDADSEARVLGVAKDGLFVRRWEVLRSAKEGWSPQYELHAADGAVLAWSVVQKDAWAKAVKAVPRLSKVKAPSYHEDDDALEKRLVADLGLTPLQRSKIAVGTRNPRHESDDLRAYCILFEAYAAGSGTVIATEDWRLRRCHSTNALLLKHPHSALWFLAFRDGARRSNTCYQYKQDVWWLPAGRLKSATLAGKAERKATAGKAERKATKLLAEALKLDPTNGYALTMKSDWDEFGVGKRPEPVIGE